MQLFLDSADINEIESAKQLGVISGVTTNQSILARSITNGDFMDYLRKLVQATDMPISIEVPNDKLSNMLKSAIKFADISQNVVIKVPMLANGDGLRLAKELTSRQIPVNFTTLMSERQVILSLMCKPKYISIFYNRILSVGDDPLVVIQFARSLINRYQLHTKIIAGSIHSSMQAVGAFEADADIVTLPYNILLTMIAHTKTNEVLEEFDKSWETLKQKCTVSI